MGLRIGESVLSGRNRVWDSAEALTAALGAWLQRVREAAREGEAEHADDEIDDGYPGCW